MHSVLSIAHMNCDELWIFGWSLNTAHCHNSCVAAAPSPYLPGTPGGPPMTPGVPSYLPGTPGGQPMTPGTGALDPTSPAIGVFFVPERPKISVQDIYIVELKSWICDSPRVEKSMTTGSDYSELITCFLISHGCRMSLLSGRMNHTFSSGP